MSHFVYSNFFYCAFHQLWKITVHLEFAHVSVMLDHFHNYISTVNFYNSLCYFKHIVSDTSFTHNTFVSPYVEKRRWLQNNKYQMK